MHSLSQKLALFITKATYFDDTTEMVSYSIEAILTTSVTAIISFLISIILNCTLEYLIFNLCFIPLRLRHKSFHFKKYIQCFIYSNLMIIFCSLILRTIHLYYIFMLIFYMLLFLFYWLSIERDIQETLIIALLFTLSLFFNRMISSAMLLSVSMNTILMIGRLYNEKNIKHD